MSEFYVGDVCYSLHMVAATIVFSTFGFFAFGFGLGLAIDFYSTRIGRLIRKKLDRDKDSI